jgi:hypothetical protein
MQLTTNHKDKEINDFIMDYLYDNFDIKGNEDYLVNELFTDFIGDSDIRIFEDKISIYFDACIEFPKDLKLIELK